MDALKERVVNIYTARIGSGAPNLIDITVKSSSDLGKCFEPTWEMVGGHKHWRNLQKGITEKSWWSKYEPMDDAQYTEAYKALLKARYKENPKPFLAYLELWQEISLGCYCKPGDFCHRHIALEMLQRLATQVQGLELVYKGEWIDANAGNNAIPGLFDEEGGQSAKTLEPPVFAEKRAILETPQELALQVVEMLRPYCARIEIGGSIRRGKKDPKDAEIIVIPGDGLHDYLDLMVEEKQIEKGSAWGEKQRKFLYRDLKIDLYMGNEENWGALFWLRTGPGDAGREVMKWLGQNRWPIRFQEMRVWYAKDWQYDGKAWTSETKIPLRIASEDDVFTLLGMPFIPPDQRDVYIYLDKLGTIPPDWSAWLPVEPTQRDFSEMDEAWTSIKRLLLEDDPDANGSLAAPTVKEPPAPFDYQYPWLTDGGVWCYVGYGDFEVFPLDSERANARLAELRRYRTFREQEREKLKHWLFLRDPNHKVYVPIEDKKTMTADAQYLNIALTSGVDLTVQDFVGARTAVLGISGSGKTNTSAVLVEELIPHIPMTIIDIEGEYWGLKSKFPILIVGRSPKSDLALGTIHAAKLAEYSYKNGVSVILDFKYHDEEEEMFEFLAGYMQRLWDLAIREQKPYHVVVEECHEFIPQMGTTDVTKLFKKFAMRGRKHGLGMIFASQRSTGVDKNILTQAGLYFLHSVIHPKDMQVYKELIPQKPAEVEALVGGLVSGHCVFMKNNKPRQAQIRRRDTFHAGATPTLANTKPIDQPDLKAVSPELIENLRNTFHLPDNNLEDVELQRATARILELEEENRRLTAERDELQRQIDELKKQPVTLSESPAPEISATDDPLDEIMTEIVEPAIEQRVRKAEEAALKSQQNGFNKLCEQIRRSPKWQLNALAILIRREKALRLDDIAASVGISLNKAYKEPFDVFTDAELMLRYKIGRYFVYEANAKKRLAELYPDLDLQTMLRQIFA